MLAGMDVSGNPESGNHKFMAIVVGTEESIAGLARRIGPRPVHMSTIRSRDAKNAIIDNISFDGSNTMGLCLHLEKKRTFARLQGGTKQNRRFANNKKLSRTYHSFVWNLARDPMERFLRLHRFEVHRLHFQCDIDCRDFVNDRGWHQACPGIAHALADVLAWGNSHGREPKGAICLDLADSLEGQMVRHFR